MAHVIKAAIAVCRLIGSFIASMDEMIQQLESMAGLKPKQIRSKSERPVIDLRPPIQGRKNAARCFDGTSRKVQRMPENEKVS